MLKNAKIILIIFIFIFCFSLNHLSYAGLSDFNLSNRTIDLDDLLSGGPPKDGIPALTDPAFIPAEKAEFLTDHDRVVGLIVKGQAKAYPIKILNWHEVVNDSIGKKPVAVTWCPLTRSAVAFDRQVDGEVLEFGVSGLLYNSNVAMYDRNHSGLWSQLKMGGLTGKLSSQALKELPAVVTTWEDWQKRHPQTLVLSPKTGYQRNYHRDPYQSYHTSRETMFPVKSRDARLAPKDLVIGLKIKGVTKAYPLAIIHESRQPIQDKVAGISIKIHASPEHSAYITDKEGDVLPATVVYWFAWSTFYKNTLVYKN